MEYTENDLLSIIDNGKTLLENLILNNEKFHCSFCDEKSMKIIYEYKRFDLLEFISVDLLLKIYDNNKTYLECIIDYFKERNNEYNLSILDPYLYTENINIIAKFYIIFAKYNCVEYLTELTEVELFKEKKGKYLIDILLEMNKNLTLNTILCDEVKKSFRVGIYLKLNNINQNEIKIKLMNGDLASKYIEEFYSDYSNCKIDFDSEIDLDTLKDFMLSDSNSNKKLIDSLINTYRFNIHNNNPYAREEIIQLCNIKMNIPDFSIKMDKSNNVYDSVFKKILLNKNLINTLNHEIGHALFNLLTNKEVPNEYYLLSSKVRSSYETLDYVKIYSDKYFEISQKINEFVDREYDYYYNDLTDDKEIEKIKNYLDYNKQKYIEEYMKEGYKKETLEKMFKNVFSVDEYIKQHLIVRKSELRDAIFRCEYGYYLAVGDIIDAIYMGEFFDDKLKTKSGEQIKGCSGHGIYYYHSDDKNAFDEIMANYSQIIKSPHREEGINLLKNIVGNELVEFIDNYYKNEIVESKKFMNVKVL